MSPTCRFTVLVCHRRQGEGEDNCSPAYRALRATRSFKRPRIALAVNRAAPRVAQRMAAQRMVLTHPPWGGENDDEPKLAEVLTEVNTLAKEANEKNLCQQQLNMNNPGCGLGQNVVYDPSVYAALDAKSRTVIAPPVDLLCTILGLCLHITAETGKGSTQGDDAEIDEPPKGSTAGTPTPRTPTGDKKVPEGSGNLGLRQQLALEEAQSANSERIMEGRINDPRYPDDLWAKMRYVHRSQDGSTIVVHFWENVLTGAREGFKIK